ncbi:MAG: hypothetical protein IJL79_00090, partial [Candidatus Methanomethylophilaceae archaeon]|nr:hypothetical protein [Candidatus Methanomethylophilaceae archaeon]
MKSASAKKKNENDALRGISLFNSPTLSGLNRHFIENGSKGPNFLHLAHMVFGSDADLPRRADDVGDRVPGEFLITLYAG